MIPLTPLIAGLVASGLVLGILGLAVYSERHETKTTREFFKR